MHSQTPVASSSSLSILCKDDDRNEDAAEIMSRRRLVFRPLKRVAVVTAFDLEQNLNCTTVNNVEKSLQFQPTPTNELDRSRRILWTLREQTTFYDAFKMYGKDFEAIAKFMVKRKFNKDKEQIKNYYINTFKLLRGKARIDEKEWVNIPRDVRELFLLINGFEWHKRFAAFPSDQEKFKNLIFDGVVSFRPKRKKFMVTIRTPYCPALSKFFPFDKRNMDVPLHLIIKLKPLRNKDFEFVTTCQQNPFLQFNVNVNDKILTIFDFLQRKWSQNMLKIPNKWDIPHEEISIKLFVQDDIKFRKIVYGIDEENSPLLSINRMKKELQTNLNPNSDDPKKILDGSAATVLIKNGKSQLQRHTIAIPSDLFEINDEKIRVGMTKQDVGNASFLQLYYILEMNTELIFNYEINNCNGKFTPWEQFISLINRDYDDRMAKSTNNLLLSETQVSDTAKAKTKSNFINNLTMELEEIKNPNQKSVDSGDIIEQENQKFIKQIKAQAIQQRRPKRQIKLLPDCHRSIKYPSLIKQSNDYERNLTIQNGIIMGLNKQDNRMNQNVDSMCQLPSTSQSFNQATDFSILHPANVKGIFVTTSDFVKHSTIDLTNEINSDSTAFSPFSSNLLSNSPNKSLPEDVRNACEQMLKETSIDYCRKFETLTRMHLDRDSNSPIKIFTLSDAEQNLNG